jgi:hypothetical protein
MQPVGVLQKAPPAPSPTHPRPAPNTTSASAPHKTTIEAALLALHLTILQNGANGLKR